MLSSDGERTASGNCDRVPANERVCGYVLVLAFVVPDNMVIYHPSSRRPRCMCAAVVACEPAGANRPTDSAIIVL